MFGKYSVFETICSFFLPLHPEFLTNSKFQTHRSYVARNNRLRSMYKFTKPQATNSRFAFFSRPR